MRRQISVLLIAMMGATGLISAVRAAAQDPDFPNGEPILAIPDPDDPPVFGPLTGVWEETVDVELEQVPAPQMTQSHASDSCSEAPAMALHTFGNAGDLSIVNNMTSDPSDPVLGCMWGRPQNPRGYRTVWYKFVAPVSGHLVVRTSFQASNFQDSYDTVLALYLSPDGTCGSLNMIACDDDTTGFFSHVSMFVIEGRTYYIEVADRSLAVQGPATLRLSVVLEEGQTLWERVGEGDGEFSAPAARSRHSIVSDGRYIYLIGGETVVEEHPVIIGDVHRFDTQTRTWLGYPPFKPLPRPYYSRTSAALLNGRIYVPSGYVGSDEFYEGEHWVYDLATQEWDHAVNVPWGSASASAKPYAWHQAVSSPVHNGYFVTGGLLEGDPSQLIPPISIVPTGSLLFYNANTSNWNTNLPDMQTARFAHVADLLNTAQGPQVCVAGGLTRLDRDPDPDLAGVVNSVECYHPATQQWTTRAPMAFPRFGAGSAVGPDGKWYVFGGVDTQLSNVTLTEVYDPVNDTWQVLDSRYSVRRPGRAWVRGAFGSNALWIFGGEEIPGNEVIPLVERLPAPGTGIMLPTLFNSNDNPAEPNDTMAQAIPIALGQEVQHTFETHEDFFDFFVFNAATPGEYGAHVRDIPSERNYDVYIYNRDKLLVGHSTNIGNLDESAYTFVLDPGPYYVLVMRAFGEPGGRPYRLVVSPTGP